MTSHNLLPYATPTCDSYGRTDGRTNGEPHSPTADNSPDVTRTRTYGDSSWADLLDEAIDALEVAQQRLGAPRFEARDEIHPWTRRAIYWRDRNRCQWCGRGWDDAGMLVLDHIVPWAAGGSSRSDNLRTLCVPCNDDRSNFATDVYARVTPVGMCDQCAVRTHREGRDDQGAHAPVRVFCGRCGRDADCTNPRRVA